MSTLGFEKVKLSFRLERAYYSSHCKDEMIDEPFGRIFEHEIFEAIMNGEVIEEYLNDKPYPSMLIYGKTNTGRPIHVVVAFDNEEEISILVTTYQPNPILWTDFKKRRL